MRFRLVLISLILGCTCLFVLLYSNNVVRRETARRFHSEGADLFSIIHRHGKSGRGASQIRRLNPSLLNVLKRDPSFIVGVTTESHRVEKVRYQGNEIETSVIGVTAGYRTVFDLKMQQGRFISELDSTAGFCVVGNKLHKRWTQATADSLIGRSLQIGRQV
ncbi:ABC transporter permease, partial [bacterium]|nr:ABC transporter permease [bacterium]